MVSDARIKIGTEVVTVKTAVAIAKAAKQFQISVAESVRDYREVESWLNSVGKGTI